MVGQVESGVLEPDVFPLREGVMFGFDLESGHGGGERLGWVGGYCCLDCDFLEPFQQGKACCAWDPFNCKCGFWMSEEDFGGCGANDLAYFGVVMSGRGLAPRDTVVVSSVKDD
jgi:hypothetical protein